VGKKFYITDTDNQSGTHGKIVIGRRKEKYTEKHQEKF
jgi:hypothetical protein